MTVSIPLPNKKRKPRDWKITYNGSEESVLSKRCHIVIETNNWNVLIFPDGIKIGCKKYTYDKWMDFYEDITGWNRDYENLVSYFQDMGLFKAFANKVMQFWDIYGSKLNTRWKGIKSKAQRKITAFMTN